MSLATASRVLNGSTRKVAETYRERVEAAAAEARLHREPLRPGDRARHLGDHRAARRRHRRPVLRRRSPSGVARGADEAGLVVTIAITERDPEREARLVRALRGQRPRGLILAASRTTESSDAGGCRPSSTRSRRRAAASSRSAPAPATCARSTSTTAAARAHSAPRSPHAATATRSCSPPAKACVTSDDRIAGFTDGFTAAGGDGARGCTAAASPASRASSSWRRRSADGVEPGTLVFAISDVVAIGAMSAVRDAGPRGRRRHRAAPASTTSPRGAT